MSQKSGSGSAPYESPIQISVFKIVPGSTLHVRMLSPEVDGLFIHWRRGGGVYCDPDTCCTGVHKADRFWRGFIAAEVYEHIRKRWIPTCFPVTERLELDFRHRYKRGQTWKIRQLVEANHKKQPLRGELVEEFPANTMPGVFPILPVIRTVYHAPLARLGQKNPMPDAVLVAPSAAPPPKGTIKEDVEMDPAEWKRLRKQYELDKEKLSNGAGIQK